MISRNTAIAVVAVAVGALTTLFLLNGAVTGSIFGKVTLPSFGTLRAVGVGVYWDSGCNSIVGSVDWGVVEPGATKNVVVYIKNEGTDPVTLSLDTENWNPSAASSHISLTWEYGGEVVAVGGVVEARLSLAISDTIEGITSFSFDIVIAGSG
ncbi:MAG: hypothetical protein JSW53_06080 [Candidatus Bathyarchaeota archaeon]|nr:MAG: hypothetical protein JSW53_06080 [Candidatus Bathyarchaeota archaeon]